jgi:hypothetical protein
VAEQVQPRRGGGALRGAAVLCDAAEAAPIHRQLQNTHAGVPAAAAAAAAAACSWVWTDSLGSQGKWHLGFFTQAHTPVGRGYCMIPLSLQPLADTAAAVRGLVPAYIAAARLCAQLRLLLRFFLRRLDARHARLTDQPHVQAIHHGPVPSPEHTHGPSRPHVPEWAETVYPPRVEIRVRGEIMGSPKRWKRWGISVGSCAAQYDDLSRCTWGRYNSTHTANHSGPHGGWATNRVYNTHMYAALAQDIILTHGREHPSQGLYLCHPSPLPHKEIIRGSTQSVDQPRV